MHPDVRYVHADDLGYGLICFLWTTSDGHDNEAWIHQCLEYIFGSLIRPTGQPDRYEGEYRTPFGFKFRFIACYQVP